MKTIKYLLLISITAQYINAQSINIGTGSIIFVGQGSDICAGEYGNITGNLIGEGTECEIPILEQFTEPTSISLTGVYGGSVVWGDYDNDDDLDILLTGRSNTGPVSKIYRNNSDNTFTEQTSIALIGVSYGSSAWGDYDNDGDLDFLLTGTDNINFISRVYRNNGDNSFTEQTSIVLPGVYFGSVAWGDYDNDGDLDILLTGSSAIYVTDFISRIYRNNGNNTFTEQTSITLPGVAYSSVAWGDYDNDQDLDILLIGLSGQLSQGIPISKIYRNNSDNTFTEQSSINLRGIWDGSGAWGDYDNDGDLDILLTADSTLYMSSIYRNNGDNTFTELTSVSLTGVIGSVAWGDYDNDGDLDILLTGYSSTGPISQIYRNNGNNTFTEQTSISLTGVENSSVAWCDYDNDSDLDILLTGNSSTGPVTKIYSNNNLTPNTLPTLPTNLLLAAIGESSVQLIWDKSTDTETPQNALKYNLVIGTSSNAIDILSPMSDRNTGYRWILSLGNTNHNNTWTIKDLEPGNYYWSVQAIDNCFAGSAFSSEETFSLITAANWTNEVTMRDAAGSRSTGNLFFGQKPNATNGIDPLLGEDELPAVPPSGTFDARFILPTIPEVGSLIDFRDSTESEIIWLLTFQPGPAGYPMTFEWDTLSFPPGTFYLTDTLTGNIVNVNMRNQSSFIISDQTITSLYIKFQRPFSTFQLFVNVTNGWNMVSAPGLHPTNQNVETWWPHRTGTVWEFSGVQYVPRLVTTPGEGYWMKNTLTETYNYPAIQIVPHNPVPVTLGWNLMSGYETSPTITELKAANPQITGTVWGFNGVQYEAATNLVPGYGYWAKVTSAGNIIIPDALAKGNGEVLDLFKEDWGRITITDAAGLSYTLYAVKGEVDLSQYEMPPLPPAGMFDIRFNSGRIAEDINSSMQTIDMVGITYPLTVRVEGMDIRLMDATGKAINQNLKSGEDIVISDATINKLMVSGELIPAVYALKQNYPNPFNPSTKIKYSVPNSSQVVIKVFDILGNEIETLVKEEKPTGTYELTWNAANLSSGIYFYQLKAGNYVNTKKMILLK